MDLDCHPQLRFVKMEDEIPETRKSKGRSGPSGWKKYNELRARTGVRLDPYPMKRPAMSNVLPPAVAGTVEQATTDREVGAVQTAENTSTEEGLLVAVLRDPPRSSAAAVAVEAPAVAHEMQRRDTSTSQKTAVAAQTPAVADTVRGSPPSPRSAVAEEKPAVAARVARRSIGVGEHVSGEPFLWRGIWEMP